MGRKLSYGMAINEALHQTVGANERVLILGEDVVKIGGDFGITKGIREKWPNRIKDTTLSESAILGLPCGVAVCGLKPVLEIMFVDFLGAYFDQPTNNVAKLNFVYQGKAYCGITVRAVQGGGIRCVYHHPACMESWFMSTLGFVVVCSTILYEVKGTLISATKSDNPAPFPEHKTPYNVKGEVSQEMYEIPPHEVEVERGGNDITIVATQIMLDKTHKATDIIAKEGVSAEIIDSRIIYPYDKDMIQKSVAKTGRTILAQEGPKCGGWGAELSVMISEDVFEYLYASIKRVTSLDSSAPYASVLEDYVLPQLDDLVETRRELMEY